jgi:hypothetical protein
MRSFLRFMRQIQSPVIFGNPITPLPPTMRIFKSTTTADGFSPRDALSVAADIETDPGASPNGGANSY